MSSANWTSMSTPYVTPRAAGETDAWTEEAARQGGRGSNRIAFTGEASSPPFVAEAFGIEEGEPVVARRRIVFLDERPVEIATSYYPVEIASGTALERPGKIKGGAVSLLAELGHVARHVTENVFAYLPNDEERSDLQLAVGDPVLTIHRATRNDAGSTFQAEIMTAPAQIRHLRYEMEVG